jgi:hypothetical protein
MPKRVLLLGNGALRSARSFRELSAVVGIDVREFRLPKQDSDEAREHYERLLAWAEIVYFKPYGSVDYGLPDVNSGSIGIEFPGWVVVRLQDVDAYFMHALPRGAEFPDALMRDHRSLVTRQLEAGVAVRGATLRWVTAQ